MTDLGTEGRTDWHWLLGWLTELTDRHIHTIRQTDRLTYTPASKLLSHPPIQPEKVARKDLSAVHFYNGVLLITELTEGACTFRPFDFHPSMKIEINFRAPWLISFEAKCKKEKSKLTSHFWSFHLRKIAVKGLIFHFLPSSLETQNKKLISSFAFLSFHLNQTWKLQP